MNQSSKTIVDLKFLISEILKNTLILKKRKLHFRNPISFDIVTDFFKNSFKLFKKVSPRLSLELGTSILSSNQLNIILHDN